MSNYIKNAFARAQLLPSLITEVQNWRSVLFGRLGLWNVDEVKFRDQTRIRFVDLRPGLEVLRDVYFERVYDRPFQLDETGVVIDLGANIGVFSLIAARRLVPRGHVIAVEPNPAVFSVLQENVVANRLRNIEVVFAAAAAQTGAAGLHFAPHSMGATIVGPTNGCSVTVPTVSLSDLVAKAGHVDLMKCDIEGAEWQIVYESDERVWSSIERVAMEFHLDSGEGRSPEDLISRFKELGYSTISTFRPPGRSPLYGYVWADRQ
jgi:FkbM family methyltransferase